MDTLVAHVAILGRAGGTQSADFSLVDTSVSTSPWFPIFPGGTNTGFAVGFFYKKGFFACGGHSQSEVCQHLALGADEWTAMPSMPNIRRSAGFVALGRTTLWVLGGTNMAGDVQQTTDMFSNGKWYPGPDLPNNAGWKKQCVHKISNTEIIVAGGLDSGGSATKAAFIYDLMDEAWTRMDDYHNSARHKSACAVHALSYGEKRVFIVSN